MKNDIYNKIKDIIIDKFDVKENKIKKNTRFKEDLGADSLDNIEFIMELEKEFNINITDKEADRMINIQECVKCIKNKTHQ